MASNYNIYITSEGIWIRHNINDLSPFGYRYNGPAVEFFSIIVAHPELLDDSIQWIVRARLEGGDDGE